MTLILKPQGRGNWRITRMRLEGGHAGPLLVRVGQQLQIGGIVFRVCEVIA